MDGILDTAPSKMISGYFDQIAKHRNINCQQLKLITEKLVQYFGLDSKGRKEAKADGDTTNTFPTQFAELERRWYRSLAKGVPDYSIYDEDVYLCGLWCCWSMYSRKYLRELRKHKPLICEHLGERVNPIRKVVDVGCGFGYTTAALCEIFPDASVTATNIEGTTQIDVARYIGKTLRRFDVVPDLNDLKGGVDIIFASEYFEHLATPIDHLDEMIKSTNARCFVVANSFGTTSPGHFFRYSVDGRQEDMKKLSRIFNKRMVEHGYTSIRTKMWNNKPRVWIKV